MKKIVFAFAVCFSLYGCSLAPFHNQQSNEEIATNFCNVFLTDCHDGTFRSLNSNTSFADIREKFEANGSTLKLIPKIILIDTAKIILTKDITIDSMVFGFDGGQNNIDQKENAKLFIIGYFISIIGTDTRAKIVADSLTAQLIDLYHGTEDPDRYATFKQVSKDDAADKSENGNRVNIHYIYAPQISFNISQNGNILIIEARFANINNMLHKRN